MTTSRTLFLSSALATTLAVGVACAPGSDEGEEGGGGGEAAAECSDVTLRLSHQWPAPTGDEPDFRAVVAQDFADQVNEATDGQVTVEVFPNATVSEPTEQYDAMMNGSIDASVFPLDYASGRVPQWSITLMPGLVRSHEHAQAWDEAEIGQAVRDSMEENGVIALTNVWNAGAVGAKGPPIITPGDVKSGMAMRAAGSYVERMLEAAGAGITSLPSSEIYTAMQTGVLDAAVTSTGSFASYTLHEQVDSYVSPTQNTFWFMYEPLIMSTEALGELCEEQQDAVTQVGEDLQEFAYTASAEDDTRVEKIFQEAGVEVVQMDDAAFEQWMPLAEKQWQAYATNVDGGQELLDLAQQVSP